LESGVIGNPPVRKTRTTCETARRTDFCGFCGFRRMVDQSCSPLRECQNITRTASCRLDCFNRKGVRVFRCEHFDFVRREAVPVPQIPKRYSTAVAAHHRLERFNALPLSLRQTFVQHRQAVKMRPASDPDAALCLFSRQNQRLDIFTF
jgi:hypothetical protein